DAAGEDADERVLRVATATAAAGFPGVPAQPPAAAGGAAGGPSPSACPPGDVVSMLTGVFGSPELFLAEYRRLLAGQLLYRCDYDTAREVRTLELLKMRFGEGAMHACEVMLKDVADSKRINHRVHSMSAAGAAGADKPMSPTSAAAAAAAAAAATAAAAAQLPPRSTPIGARTAARGQSQQQQQQRPAGGAGGGGGGSGGVNTPQVQTRSAAAAAAQQQQAAVTPAAAAPAATASAASSAAAASSAPPPPPPPAAAAPELAPGPEFELLSATILSYLFWPGQEDRDKGAPDDPSCGLLLPPEVRAAMRVFEGRYRHLKTPRSLRWRPQLGAVDLELAAGGATASFRVSPLMATLLLAFREREVLSAGELAAEVGLPVAVVRRKMLFWVNHGVIAEG
ncbi:hypothetical protein Agub_g15129, partial [Astrephomene gubernaculifera]